MSSASDIYDARFDGGKVTTSRGLPMTPVGAALTPKGRQRIPASGTGIATATGLTVPEGATIALIRPTGQAVAWSDDGVAPTADGGYPLLVGEELPYDVNLAAIQFIEISAGAVLHVVYYAVPA